MKLYKIYENDKKHKYLHDIAKKYLINNNINVTYYAWVGMAKNIDFVKTNKGMFEFNINTGLKEN